MAKKNEQEVPQPVEVENKEPVEEKKVVDERVDRLLKLLSEGVTLEKAIAEVTGLTCNPENPKYIRAVEETGAFCDEHLSDHSEIECFTQYIEEILSQFASGDITRELLAKMWKSFAFEHETKAAFEAGVVKGRNMQIEALRAEREAGDGLGALSSGSTITPKSPKLGYIEQIMQNRR
ncbi:MAG: hypothetical protein RR550_00040 [Rikenellaceae bacterium]